MHLEPHSALESLHFQCLLVDLEFRRNLAALLNPAHHSLQYRLSHLGLLVDLLVQDFH